MKLNFKPMGSTQTNCYIVTVDDKDFIIDPGMGATQWVIENTTNPIAILNTHGHFDHVWSNKELKEKLNIPIFTPTEDVFMLKEDPLGYGVPESSADIQVEGDQILDIEGVKVQFLWMPGHTPGCSMIIIGEYCFSGDFVFENSIGRVDFPFSNPSDMKKSIQKFQALSYDMTIYPGHGNPTSFKKEQGRIGNWLHYI